MNTIDFILVLAAAICFGIATLPQLATPVNFVALGLLLFCITFLTGCASNPYLAMAKTDAGSAVIAQASNRVIELGLNAGATKIDTGNPYLHSIAAGLYANSTTIVSGADVQRIVTDYGDPNNRQKMRKLASSLWEIMKAATDRVARAAAANLVADGIQRGAMVK